jgi:hypothetical protein
MKDPRSEGISPSAAVAARCGRGASNAPALGQFVPSLSIPAAARAVPPSLSLDREPHYPFASPTAPPRRSL